MPEHEPADDKNAPPTPPSKTWIEELDGRREEGIKVALRNFLVSRQFTTDGSLAEAERVVRFYEGVVMSLEPNPDIDAFGAAARAFKDVLRYEGVPKDDLQPGSNQNGLWGKRALRVQAAYNLAVLYHRRAVQIRESNEIETEGLKSQPAIPTQQSQPAGAKQPPVAGDRQFDAVLSTGLSNPGVSAQSLPSTSKLIAKSSNPFTSPLAVSERNSAKDEEDPRQEPLVEAATRYKETIDAIQKWQLKYEDWERYNEPSEENTWKKMILETGVAAIVGSLLLEVELNAKADSPPVIEDARRTQLVQRLEDARHVLAQPLENLRASQPAQDVKQGVAPAEQTSAGTGNIITALVGKLFQYGKPKVEKILKTYMPRYNKPLGSAMLQEEMLEQLIRVERRLGLKPAMEKWRHPAPSRPNQ